MVVTRQDFDDWKQNPVTKKLMHQIQLDIDKMKDLLVHVSLEDLKELQGRTKACSNLVLVEYGDLFDDN